MVEFVAGVIDHIRTVSLHQWLIKFAVAIPGVVLIVVCANVTGGVLAGAMPFVAAVLLACLLIWPESVASLAFIGISSIWWLLAWRGSIWVTVLVAVLVGLLHLLAALATGPSHAVYRFAALRYFGVRIGLYALGTAIAASLVAVLSQLTVPRYVSWVAIVAICAGTLVATVVAGSVDETGQVSEDLADPEPNLPEDLN